MQNFVLNPGNLSFDDLKRIDYQQTQLELDPSAIEAINKSQQTVNDVLDSKKIVYGINTGLGILANQIISKSDYLQLQKNLVLSHCAGTGKPLDDSIVALILLLKINALARGYSGVRLRLIESLIALYNHRVYPIIPVKGSVGASGDLAPLSHLSALLLGYNKARHQGKIIDAKTALKIAGLSPLELAPKEGLALLNGTQASTALAIAATIETENLFEAALIAGAMSVDAASGSYVPFDARIQTVRGHQPQIQVAKRLRNLLSGSKINHSHRDCKKVQDPYSLRCQATVMGACLYQIDFAKQILTIEANAVSDNPLVFSDSGDILSGGNFHAEPVAMVADNLAIAIAEIGALSERRIALLIDKHFSGLPPFLVNNAGLNSGFMIAHVTASALASENKSMAHPASVDSLPTSANQEDHVSMATFAARRLHEMVDNNKTIIAIELLAAAQGIDFHAPKKTSPQLQNIHDLIRKHIPFYEDDRYFADDIETMKKLLPEIKMHEECQVVS